jgi:hypothetical protein
MEGFTYNPLYAYSQDYDLILRALEHGGHKFLREKTYILRQHSSSISSSNYTKQLLCALVASFCAHARRKSANTIRAKNNQPASYSLRSLFLEYPLFGIVLFFSTIIRTRRFSIISCFNKSLGECRT